MKEPPIIGPGRGAPQLPPIPSSRSSWSQWVDSRGAVLAMLFCVTGLLGIPFLWMSSKFTRTEKIVWSCLVTLYTLLLISGAAAVCWWSFTQISQILRS